jgi:hypothetical protein
MANPHKKRMKMKVFVFWLEGGLFTVATSLTPVGAYLAGVQPFTVRGTCAVIIAGIVAGALAMKGYLSGNKPPPSYLSPPPGQPKV